VVHGLAEAASTGRSLAVWKSDDSSGSTTPPTRESEHFMAEIIAGVEIPESSAVAEATRLIEETTTPLLFHHSRRVFLFGSIHGQLRGLEPDPELLYLAALFHDTGLLTPFSETEQRFEIDGADHARAFLLEHGFSARAVEVVWNAIALHTTPGIPARMGPEVAATSLGVLTDAIGHGLDELDVAVVGEITAAHPRGDFKNEFVQTFHEGLKHRPDTTYGTINADVLEHFVPGFRRTSMVERITASAWPA
jgi:HD superfamily phosphodiesterase